jgi:predicted ATPase
LLAHALEITSEEKPVFLQLARRTFSEPHPFLSPVKTDRPPENLPNPLTSLVDRQRDIASVTSLLSDPSTRWITLIGPPGIGKTRLSIECGKQMLKSFTEGVWFVDLSLVESSSFVLPAIIRCFSNQDLPPSSGYNEFSSWLKNRRLLLVLDNFEHVTEAALEFAALLKSCAGLKVLATSRVPLHLYGEYQYQVPPLSIPPDGAEIKPEILMEYESVQLFVVRARQHQPNFSVSFQNATAIADICVTLEGIPLALELAAATLQRMTLEEINAMIHSQQGSTYIQQLSTPARDLPSRQRTLENMISWRYSLLSEVQRELFCKLSVFSGWFDVDAVQQICLDDCLSGYSSARDLLYNLSEQSLLVRGEFAGVIYWRMLEIMNAYANSRINPDIREALRSKHAIYFRNLIQAVSQSGVIKDPNRLFQIHGQNFQSALSWAVEANQINLAYDLLFDLPDLWESVGYLREGLSMIQRILEIFDQSEPITRARIIEEASDLAWQQHDFETALKYSEAAMQIARLHGLDQQIFWYLNRLGRTNIEQGFFEAARKYLEEARQIAVNPGIPLAQLGEVAFFEGRLEDARTMLLESLGYLSSQDEIFLAMALTDLAELALIEGDFVAAHHWLTEAFEPASHHIRRLICYLSTLSGLLALNPENDLEAKRDAVRFQGFIGSIIQRVNLGFSVFYQRLNEQRREQLESSLPYDSWQKEYNAGFHWSKESALMQARVALLLGI